VGLGKEVLFILVLGLLVWGPKQPQVATSRLHLQPEFTAVHHQQGNIDVSDGLAEDL
jgi:hypothetical protein